MNDVSFTLGVVGVGLGVGGVGVDPPPPQPTISPASMKIQICFINGVLRFVIRKTNRG
jgi:hypothetical protein